MFQPLEPKQSIKQVDKIAGNIGEFKRQTLYNYNIYMNSNEQIYFSNGFENEILKYPGEYKNDNKEQKQPLKVEQGKLNIPIAKEALIPKDFVCDFTGLSAGHGQYARYNRKKWKFLPLKRAGLEILELKGKNSRCNWF